MRTLITAAALSLLMTSQVWADTGSNTATGRLSDTFLEGSIETSFLLNSHLNSFEINTDVDNGIVTLSGVVDESIDKDLAGEIARSFDGVQSVKNDIQVAAMPGEAKRRTASSGRSFSDTIGDATTTAAVKSRLLWNKNTEGSNINVDTMNSVVTLKGEVRSGAEKDLAERLAENTNGVRRVDNLLTVNSEQTARIGSIDLDRVSNNAGSAIRKLDDESAKTLDEKKVEKNARGALKDMSRGMSDTWITTKAKSTLLFSSETAGASVDVTTNQGVVSLTGSARTQRQKDYILESVRDLVGVQGVNDKLQVKPARVS